MIHPWETPRNKAALHITVCLHTTKYFIIFIFSVDEHGRVPNPQIPTYASVRKPKKKRGNFL